MSEVILLKIWLCEQSNSLNQTTTFGVKFGVWVIWNNFEFESNSKAGANFDLWLVNVEAFLGIQCSNV